MLLLLILATAGFDTVDDPLDLDAFEIALDDPDPTGLGLDRLERRLEDRIVQLANRRGALSLGLIASIDWRAAAPLRSQAWSLALVLRVELDALLLPPPRPIGAPHLERLRQRRCESLRLDERVDRARWSALECGAPSW